MLTTSHTLSLLPLFSPALLHPTKTIIHLNSTQPIHLRHICIPSSSSSVWSCSLISSLWCLPSTSTLSSMWSSYLYLCWCSFGTSFWWFGGWLGCGRWFVGLMWLTIWVGVCSITMGLRGFGGCGTGGSMFGWLGTCMCLWEGSRIYWFRCR